MQKKKKWMSGRHCGGNSYEVRRNELRVMERETEDKNLKAFFQKGQKRVLFKLDGINEKQERSKSCSKPPQQ